MIDVGPLVHADRPAVESLLRATRAFSESEVDVALEVVDDALAAAQRADPDPDYLLVAARTDDALIGYAAFGPTPETDRSWDLYWIAVHPDAQGAGAGAALLRAAEQEIVKREGRLVAIETSSRDDYSNTRTFYERLGYAEQARLTDFYAPGDDRVVFTRLTRSHRS
ncbi:MAG: putative acetyltransferase [Gemmatimonadetes bacterium]|nr:putative acetyltransferase [Gemmatimonadota bacterium]